MPRPGRGGDLFASMKIKAAVNTDDGVRRSRLGTMRANHQVSSASPAGTIMLRLRIKDIAWRQRGRSILAAVIVNDSFAASNRNGAVRVQISRPGPIPGQILLTILRKLRGPRSKASRLRPRKTIGAAALRVCCPDVRHEQKEIRSFSAWKKSRLPRPPGPTVQPILPGGAAARPHCLPIDFDA